MPLTPQDFVSKWKRDFSAVKNLEKLLAFGSHPFASGVLRKFGEGKVNK